MLDKFRERIRDDWRAVLKYTSTKWAAAGVILGVFFQVEPDVAIQAWQALPDDLKALLPVRFVNYATYGMIGWAMWKRMTVKEAGAKQEKSDDRAA